MKFEVGFSVWISFLGFLFQDSRLVAEFEFDSGIRIQF